MKINFEKLKELDPRVAEAYKTLRTNISFCGEKVKVIGLTSAFPDEGKSTVSFQLAKAFSRDHKKTLYLDADMRKSVTLSRYGVDAEVKGLTHFLSGQVGLDDCIYETSVKNMDIIFTGPLVPNSSELLGNEHFIELIAKLREMYDYVIVDCPPLGNIIDAAVIAKVCDGFVLVIESEKTSYHVLQGVKKQIEASGCWLLGAVLNKVEMKSKKYSYKYGYGYYNKYGDYYGTTEETEALEEDK
jgi:capsular exopolysaccharide synthesis family protein